MKDFTKRATKREMCLNVTEGICSSEFNKKITDDYLDKIKEIELLVLWKMATSEGNIFDEMDELRKDDELGSVEFEKYVRKLKKELKTEMEALPIKLPDGVKIGDLLNIGNVIKRIYFTIKAKGKLFTDDFIQNYNPKGFIGYRYNQKRDVIEVNLFGYKVEIFTEDTRWAKRRELLKERSSLGAILERDGLEYYLYV